MIKFCKQCKEEKNEKCKSGYSYWWKDTVMQCPNCGGTLVNIDFPENDLNIIEEISEDADFIEAMIKLRQDDIVEYQLKMSQFRNQVEQQKSSSAKDDNHPKCPTCGSTNIEKISLTKKALGGIAFGLFSSDVRNTMHCKNCSAKW